MSILFLRKFIGILLLTFLVVSCSNNVDQPATFREVSSIKEALEEGAKLEGNSFYITHKFSLNEEEVTGFFLAEEGLSSQALTTKWEKIYKGMAIDIGNAQGNESGNGLSEQSFQEIPEFKVESVFITTPVDSSASVSQSNELSTQGWWNGGTAPDSGLIYTGPSTYGVGNRYAYNYFQWNNDPSFGHYSTYEHDFFLNNDPNSSLGSGTYLTTSQTWQGYPTVEYVASTLPSAYLDTRAFDGSDEVAYTIGSGWAKDIVANSGYYTYFISKNGLTSQDNGKLSAQIGEQRPWGCSTTWCSFSTNIITLVPAWTVPVPGVHNW